jgi:hypothetical protein
VQAACDACIQTYWKDISQEAVSEKYEKIYQIYSSLYPALKEIKP